MFAEYLLHASVSPPTITPDTTVFSISHAYVDHRNGRNRIHHRQCILEAWFGAGGEPAYRGENA